VRQSLLTVGMLVLVCAAWMLRDLVMLVGFAALLAYALDPLVSLLERAPLPGRRHLPRGVAAGLVVLVLGLIAGAVLFDAIPRLIRQLARFAATAPAALAGLEQSVRGLAESRGWGNLLPGDRKGLVASLLDAIQHGSASLAGRAVGSLGGLAGIVLVPLFALYMLADRGRARAGVLESAPANRRAQATRLLDALDRALRAYVRGQALVCLAMGTAIALVLWLLGFRVAFLLGVVAGVGEIVPVLGFWIAAAAIALEGYSIGPGLAVAGVVAYMVVDYSLGTFVNPRLLGKQIKLHPFIVNVSVIGGGMLLGPAGAILALPAAAMAKSLLDEFRGGSR